MGKTKKITSISVFFPCYNDKGTIATMVADAESTVKKITGDFEIIVIDDGSTDGSRELLKNLVLKCPYLKIIFHEKNKGYGGALRSGFKNATKDFIFYTDGDAQYDIRELTKLADKFEETDVDWINGYKIKRNDPFQRVIIGKIYQYIMKFLFNLKVKDVDCDFRLMKREIFDKVNLESNSGMICTEMMRKFQNAGFKVAEVGVHHYFRTYGKSQFFNFKRIFKTGVNIIQYWFKLILLPKIKKIIDWLAKNPSIFFFLRKILENDFKIEKEIIKKELNTEEGKILDFGCGMGNFSVLFKPENYFGVDIEQNYINYARKHYQGTFKISDGKKLDFNDGYFDKAMVIGVFHHLEDKNVEDILREIKRTLKKEGEILIMEDIEVQEKKNLWGKVIHFFDRGAFIRETDDYKLLFSRYFEIQKTYKTKSGCCDYAVFLLTNH